MLRPHFLGLLAEALAQNHQIQDGLRFLEEALAGVNRSGEAYYEPELYRLKGELLLAQAAGEAPSQILTVGKAGTDTEVPVVAKAQACFDQSIKIARSQKAKSWELRTTISLARLYRDQGKQSEARSLLATIYAAFTEGFDTADLKEAKALLGDLSLKREAGHSAAD